MGSPKILFAEDDNSLGFIIKDNLELAGYEVSHFADGQAAWQAFQKQHFQLCLLDVMLPGLNGFQIAANIRTISEEPPFLFLTARSLKEDRIAGLKLGADDYIVKPFSIEELLLRIKVILRRSETANPYPSVKSSSSKKVTIGHYLHDFENYQLLFEGNAQKLTARENELLQLLWEYNGTVVSREKILQEIWGENDYFKGRSMDVFISRLRKYLKSDPKIVIENIHGVGFCLKVVN